MSFLSRSFAIHVLLSPLLIATTANAQQLFCEQFCWCIPGDDGPPGCPPIQNRRLPASFGNKDYPESEVSRIANLKPNIETLVDFVGDTNCQPYEVVAEFLDVELCEPPTGDDEDKVCLFVFDEGQNNCKNRQDYSLMTVDTTELSSPPMDINSMKNRAVVTHKGECGVCSSAQDLAVYLDPSLLVTSYICGNILGETWEGLLSSPLQGLPLQAALSAAFEAAVDCFSDGGDGSTVDPQVPLVGFSRPCAKLNAANAANSYLNGCKQDCNDYLNPCLNPNLPPALSQTCPIFGLPPIPQLGGPSVGIFLPGTCDLNDCLDCDESLSGEIYGLYAGRTRRSSGIVTVFEQPTGQGAPLENLFFGLKRDCSTVANIDAGICGTIDELIEGTIEI